MQRKGNQVTHDDIVAEIQSQAEDAGIFSHYCKSTIRCCGTPGMPDIFLAGMRGTVWLEVKTSGDRLKSGQISWKYMLQSSMQRYYVIGADELEDGSLAGILELIRS